MSTFNLTSNTTDTLICDALPDTASNVTAIATVTHASLSPSLSSFEIIFIAACSSFLTLIFAGLFNFLKINITQKPSEWTPPAKADFDKIIEDIKQSYITAEQQRLSREKLLSLQPASLSSFPPQNRYYPIVCNSYKLFLEAINGTERDGWFYQGERNGVSRYKKDIHASSLSMYRGEKILNYPQNILIHAIRNKKIRLLVGDGQMKDCGALEIIDENTKVEFEEYKSPAPFVMPREFVYVDAIHRLHDGTIISFAKSIQHPARPASDKFARADLKIGGWALKPIPDEPNRTKVVYVVRCDLGGTVPGFVINQITSDIPLTVERLNAALRKFGDVQVFNKPLMDVLLYGPKTPKAMQGDEEVDDDEKKIQGNGVVSAPSRGGFKYPEATQEQKQKFAQILRENQEFWTSKAYLDMIPKDKKWIKRRPKLTGGTLEQHEQLLDSFVIPDKPFKYRKAIEDAFALFNTWRKWQNVETDSEDGWKFRTQKEDLKIYSHALPGEAVDIIKGEAVIPYSVPIITGILLNPNHREKWDSKIDELCKVEKCSEYSHIIYLSVKTPTIFITYRDMVALVFVYPLPDGSILMGSRSIEHPNYPPKKTRVRATINLDMWHIRPLYEMNTIHSKVTHYAHVGLGGSLPTWLVNETSTDLPSGILKVRQYIRNMYEDLHKPGMLYVPPWPFLKSMGVDIGWMDPDPEQVYDDEDTAPALDAQDQRNGHEDLKEVDEDRNEAEEDDEKRETEQPTQQQLLKTTKSPALHFVMDRQRTLSRDLSHPTNASNQSGSVTSSSSKRRLPNYNLMVANPSTTITQQSSTHSNDSNSKLTPHSKSSVTRKRTENRVVVTRTMWEQGERLNIQNDIYVKNVAMQSMSNLLLKKKESRLRQSPLADDEEVHHTPNDEEETADVNADERKETETETDEDAEIASKYKYTLRSSLSVRNAASYMTLGNCAVSELLQQTDPSSKEYWVPSDAKTPRGIFVYKFIHSRERYYHYMGKAILHHEPKFIYETLIDPTFRFEYDKMCDEFEIVDKLDDNTYIARYLHTNKQCYIKQQRETLVVIKNKCVCPNDKYVAAGMSIEHKQYPTELGLKTFKQMEQQQQYQQSADISSLSKQLSGKGPSKAINSGILRQDIKSSGWVIERNVKKPTDSIVSYIVNINFGGSVPSAIMKSIAKKQPLAIFYLGKALKLKAKKLKQQRKAALRAQQQQQHQEPPEHHA